MLMQNYSHSAIGSILGVSVSFISKWKYIFVEQGVAGLRLKYKGSKSYLAPAEKQIVLNWLKQNSSWHLSELKEYIEDNFNVEFESNQSYYDLFKQANISWNSTQKTNPRKDSDLVAKKKLEITAWLDAHQREIVSGELVVFFEDECHLLWGDICGYIWGSTKERIEVPVINERQRQTYFGALNYYTQEFLMKPYKKGDSSNAIAFVKYLISLDPKSRIALIWDGASASIALLNSKLTRDSINQGLNESEYQVTCLRFAPNDPTQNPVEDVWLHAKNFIREFYHLCKSFSHVKKLFELVTHHQVFDFPKISMYGSFFTQLI